VVLAGVSVLVFSLIHLVKGDPVRLALGTRYSQETYDALRERNGLDQPLVEQYFTWAGRALTGDLGVSFRSGEPVTVADRRAAAGDADPGVRGDPAGPAHRRPAGHAVGAAAPVARRPVATVISQIGISVPDFWLAIVLILVFAGTLGWLPSGGYVPLTEDPSAGCSG
jgi:peptide/nickel transport system permease protein